jgi:uncharacterized membrane protein YidH (DUF202 family)
MRNKEMSRILAILAILFLLTIPTIVTADTTQAVSNSVDQTKRGLILIMMGLQFLPFGYAGVKKSFEKVEDKDNDQSVETLSNMLELGALLLLLGLVLILGGIGHLA